jgi:hypothetical protein
MMSLAFSDQRCRLMLNLVSESLPAGQPIARQPPQIATRRKLKADS